MCIPVSCVQRSLKVWAYYHAWTDDQRPCGQNGWEMGVKRDVVDGGGRATCGELKGCGGGSSASSGPDRVGAALIWPAAPSPGHRLGLGVGGVGWAGVDRGSGSAGLDQIRTMVWDH